MWCFSWFNTLTSMIGSAFPHDSHGILLSDLLKTEKNELCKQNLKGTKAQSFAGQEKNFTSASNDYEGESPKEVLLVTSGKGGSVLMTRS